MNQAAAAKSIQATLRPILRRHTTRDVDMALPLGGTGHGLDSLAMVEFAVGLEKAHGIQVPDEFWADLSSRTPHDFVRLLTGS